MPIKLKYNCRNISPDFFLNTTMHKDAMGHGALTLDTTSVS